MGEGGGGVQKCQKLPIPLKMTLRSWKFAQRYNFWSQILYYYSFKTNHKFWPFWENRRGQKGSKIAHFFKSNPSEAAYLHREIISHQIFDLILQIKNLEPFWGHPGRQMGVQKGQKLPIALIITHKSFKFALVDNFSWQIWCWYTFNRILQFFDFF